jgi:hypothetical protein
MPVGEPAFIVAQIDVLLTTSEPANLSILTGFHPC